VKETTFTVQNVSDVVDIPEDVWLKAKMFDVKLTNAGHVFGMKMVTFVMDQVSRMDATLKAMKSLIASCTELFPAMVESSKNGETSSSYSDLTPHNVVEIQGAEVGGENQHVEEEDHVEDITALTAPPIFAAKVVVPNATPVSSTVGNETLDDCHVVEITLPSPPLIFYVVVRALPPLAPLAPGFPSDSQLTTTYAKRCGDWGPRWSDSRAQWARGVSTTTTCSIFGTGQSGPQRKTEAE
jgi:hypothetical protein